MFTRDNLFLNVNLLALSCLKYPNSQKNWAELPRGESETLRQFLFAVKLLSYWKQEV